MSAVEGAGADVTAGRPTAERALGSSYVVESPIGRGTTGEVWRGHVRDTGEPIAAKVLDPDLARDPEVVARFIRERARLTRVAHPNVVTVRDLVVEGETLAVVTDLVAGPDLATLLDEFGPLDADETETMITDVLLGLDAVHAAGIVHRDLFLRNVLVEDRDGRRVARIVDFGIAQLAYGDATPALDAGRASVEYLAPEVRAGGDATPVSDLYAVGVLACELVRGRRTASSSTGPVDESRPARGGSPARPDGMPERLWTVVHRLLDADPAARPTSAADALARLGRAPARASGPVAPRPADPPLAARGRDGDDTIITATAPVRPSAPRGRSRRRAGVVALLVAVAVGVGGFVVTRPDPAPAATLASAPEYWDIGGKPVVHRTLAGDGNALLVRLRVTNVPVGGFRAAEPIPAMVRTRPITVDGHRRRPDADGMLHLRVPYRASNESRASYQIALARTRPSEAFLRRYERARVARLRHAPARDRPQALRALDVAPAIRIHTHQTAWLPVSGSTIAGGVDTEVAERLGRAWRWTSSDPRVAVVARAHPDPLTGRNATATYYTVDARAPGRTVLATVLAGRRYAIGVTVVPGNARPPTCEPGVFPGARLQLDTAPGTRHPVEGTLLAVGAGAPPVARAEAGRLIPLPADDTTCAGASVVHVSAADYLRLLLG